MIPLGIEGEGFYSFREKFSLSFEGITAAVVMGTNGAGKSTIIVDAIKYVFWGDSRDDIADAIHDDCDSCWVTYKFSNNDHVYEVTRTTKRKGSGHLSIKEDGELYKDRLNRTNKESLANILGTNLTQELLFSTCVSQQDDANAFSNMGTTKREQIITTLLNLDIWKEKAKVTGEFIKVNKDLDAILAERHEKLDIADTECHLTKGQIGLLEARISELTRQHEAQKVKYTKLLEDNKEDEVSQSIRRELDKLSGVLINLSHSLRTDFLPNEKQDALDAVHIIEEGLTAVSKEITDLYTEQLKLDAEFERIENVRRDAFMLKNRGETTDHLDIVPCCETEFYHQCPLLKLGHETVDEINLFVAEYGKGSLSDVLSDLGKRIEDVGDQRIVVSNQLRDTYAKKDTLLHNKSKYTSLVLDIEVNDRRTAEYNEKNALLEEYSKELKPTADSSILDQEREKLYNLASVQSSEIAALKQLNFSHNSLLTECQNLNEEILQLKEKSQMLIEYKVLDQAYRDIPVLLFTNTIPQIENYANNLLNQTMPGWNLQFRSHRETQKNTQKKSLDLLCSTPTGTTRKFANLSGSEKFRVSLILRLAIAWVNSELYNIPLDFFIVDEGFGSLHGNNYDSIKSMLRYIAPFFKLMLIITHIEELKDTFDAQIIVNPDGAKDRIVILK